MCLSVREAGWRIRYVASSLVRHHESVSGEERWKYAAQNVSRMNELWGNR
jgi:GT2 family glycosyltransferase